MTETRPALPSRYATPELIAYGGMGEVYRASDESLGRTVAVKVLSERYARNDEFHARFMREAQTAASLSGEPNVIVIHDVGETHDDLPFIVMEYVPGGTVADRLRAGPVAPEQSLRWLDQTAAALDRAHARGIVHRDVKPANLLVADEDTIRVSDFGIARAAGDDTLTAAGTVLGSSGYMAPEQARGEPSTPASDRYALACVAFELLTGRRPFERDNPTAEASAHATEAPPSPRAIDPDLPVALDTVFARGLAKRPEERHASCAELVAELRRALTPAPTTAATVAVRRRRIPPRPRSPATSRRRGARSVLVGAIGLLAAGAALAWALSGLGDGDGAATVVLTETVQGETVELTVTETAEGQTVERDGHGGDRARARRRRPRPGGRRERAQRRGLPAPAGGRRRRCAPGARVRGRRAERLVDDRRGLRLVQPRDGALRARPLRRRPRAARPLGAGAGRAQGDRPAPPPGR